MTTTTDDPSCSNNPVSQPVKASASAPGKLIIFGEHAVVYGQPAIASCLSDLRIKVDAQIRDDGIVSIHLPDLKPSPIDIEIPYPSLIKVDSIYETSTAQTATTLDFKTYLKEKDAPTAEDMKAIGIVLANNVFQKDDSTSNTGKVIASYDEKIILATTPLVYLINVILLPTLMTMNEKRSDSKQYGLSITAKSQNLPLGAGLGSSAAFSVAASASLYSLKRKLSKMHDSHSRKNTNNNYDDTVEMHQPSKEDLDIINILAFHSETLLHGTPSGIDNTVSTYGGALQYTKTKYGNQSSNNTKESETIFLETFPQLSVILTNTNVPRSTKELVEGVKSRKYDYPDIIDPILDAIGNISRFVFILISFPPSSGSNQ
jgi:mevalonate kinase